MKYAQKKFMLSVVIAMTLCGCSTLSSKEKPRQNPLIAASCPPLAELLDPYFGSTTLKLAEVAGQYNECRRAALGIK